MNIIWIIKILKTLNQELKNCWGGEGNSVDLALCSFHFTHNKHHALKKQKTVSHMENILQGFILFGLNFKLETLDLLWMKNEQQYCFRYFEYDIGP